MAIRDNLTVALVEQYKDKQGGKDNDHRPYHGLEDVKS